MWYKKDSRNDGCKKKVTVAAPARPNTDGIVLFD